MLEGVIPVLIGFAFLYAYLQEDKKDVLFKYTWLFISFAFFYTAFYSSYIMDMSTTNGITGVTTYNYIYNPALYGAGNGFGYIIVGMIFIFLARFAYMQYRAMVQ